MTPNPDTMDNVEFAQRLIEWSYDTRCMGWIDQDLRNAAARIVQARAEIERLREALEGDDPEMPQAIQPIGWLHTMIEESKRRGPDEKDDDPSAYWEMVGEVEALYQKAISALTYQGE